MSVVYERLGWCRSAAVPQRSSRSPVVTRSTVNLPGTCTEPSSYLLARAHTPEKHLFVQPLTPSSVYRSRSRPAGVIFGTVCCVVARKKTLTSYYICMYCAVGLNAQPGRVQPGPYPAALYECGGVRSGESRTWSGVLVGSVERAQASITA